MSLRPEPPPQVPGSASRPARRSRLVAACAAGVLVATAGGAVLAAGTGRSGDTGTGTGTGTGSSTDPRSTPPAAARADDAQRVRAALEELSTSWRHRDRAGFLAASAGTARAQRWAATTWRALAGLEVGRVDLRHLRAAVPGRRSAAAASAVVEVTWTQAGWQRPAATRMTVDLADVGAGRQGGILSWRAIAGSPAPPWALRPARVLSGAHGTLVVLPGGGDGLSPARLQAMVTTARAEVRDAVAGPAATDADPLVVVAPGSPAAFGRLLGAPAREYAGIAAVTTTVDGSSRAAAPVEVVLNPAVFGSVRPVAAQVVLTHEVTHAVTGAASLSLPLWVAEGFADYVALRGGGVPLRVSAGSALRAVLRHGAPRSLPDAEAFARGAARPGLAYEQAWLAFRLLERRHGSAATVAFHDAVLSGRRVGPALRATTGSGLAAFTGQWRAELTRLARAHG